MSRENKEEKLFNEVIDRILAGESVDTDVADNDLRSAIEFVNKMKELRTSPTEPFKANLKAKLLQQLREKEAQTEKGNWWQRTFPRRIAWQLATTVAVILIAVGITWRVGLFQPGDTSNKTAMPPAISESDATLSVQSPTALGTEGPGTGEDTGTTKTFTMTASQNIVLQAEAITNKLTYLPGEAVYITVKLTNVSSESIEVPPYPPVLISDADNQVVYTFGALPGTTVLLPGEPCEFRVVWNQFDSNNNGTALSGMYYISVGSIVHDDNTIGVNNTANNFEIK